MRLLRMPVILGRRPARARPRTRYAPARRAPAAPVDSQVPLGQRSKAWHLNPA